MSISMNPLVVKNIWRTAMVQIMSLVSQGVYERHTLMTLIFFWMDQSTNPIKVYLIRLRSLNMDYLNANPLRDVAKSDRITKLQFANVMGRALLNREAIDPAKIRDLKKGALKYSGTGIHRKLDLCEELRKKSEKLDVLLREKDKLHADIGAKAAAIVIKPIVLQENASLGDQRSELDGRVSRLAAQNKKQGHANKLISEEIEHLVQQVKAETESPGTLAKGVLAKLQRDFDKQSREIEESIAYLEQRKEELLEDLSSQHGLPLRNLLGSGQDRANAVSSEQGRAAVEAKKRAYFEYKDLVDANHAKIALQVRRSRDEVEHKWKVEVEFLQRRIEDRRANIHQLDSDLSALNAELEHRRECLDEAESRLRNLRGALSGGSKGSSGEKPTKDPAKARRFEVFVDYLSDIFSKMKAELDGLWTMSGRSQDHPDFENNLRLFAEYVAEISESLDNCKL